jgi:hypothetical protein
MGKLLLAILAVAACRGSAGAENLVAFRFTGNLFTEVEVEVFGHTFYPGDLVTGHVVYRTGVESTVPLEGCVDCEGYPVDLINGFLLQAGPLTLRYDSFKVAVRNDGLGFDPEFPEDVLGFGRNDQGPASYERRLLVNGVPHPIGFADVSLVGSSLTFPSTSLPSDPQPSDFFAGYLMIDDGSGTVIEGGEDGDMRIGGLVGGFFHTSSLLRFSVPEGDYFVDGKVSWEDYAVWQDDFGVILPSSADGNGSGLVDAADYTIWRDAMASPTFGVPEPSSLVACALLVTLLLAAPRK